MKRLTATLLIHSQFLVSIYFFKFFFHYHHKISNENDGRELRL